MVRVLPAVICCPISVPLATALVADARPRLANVAAPSRVAALHTIAADADVRVSEGEGFSASVVYHAPQRAVLQSRDANGARTMGIEGQYVWTFDGTAESERDPFVRELVLRHFTRSSCSSTVCTPDSARRSRRRSGTATVSSPPATRTGCARCSSTRRVGRSACECTTGQR